MSRDPNSRGQALAERLRRALREHFRAPRPGARALPILQGLTPACTTKLPLENLLAAASDILIETGKVFRYGNGVVLECGEGEWGRLLPLATDGQVEATAAATLANHFLCEFCPQGSDSPVQFAPPAGFVKLLLARQPTVDALPMIKTYSPRPVFDDDFVLRGPGWHAEEGILVHGSPIEPVILPEVDDSQPIWDRLPPYLRHLLSDFCLATDADAANVVAVLLTGLLALHFVTSGKPVVLLDGNQPSLGKTLLARVVGVVLDGHDWAVVRYTPDDEELQKQICATLRGDQPSVLIIDNAKVKAGSAINSPVIEANSMSPEISLRILGQSENFRRPNDVLWHITMNNTKASPDLVSRGLPVRFRYEGDPRLRSFGGRNPIEFARQYRLEILGELAGMVVRWTQRGRPEGTPHHRCDKWARTVGGILQANGFPEFLGNLNAAEAEFNTIHDELTALVETALAANDPGFVLTVPTNSEVTENDSQA